MVVEGSLPSLDCRVVLSGAKGNIFFLEKRRVQYIIMCQSWHSNPCDAKEIFDRQQVVIEGLENSGNAFEGLFYYNYPGRDASLFHYVCVCLSYHKCCMTEGYNCFSMHRAFEAAILANKLLTHS